MKWWKWAGACLGVLILVALAVLVGARFVSQARIDAKWEVRPFDDPALPTGPAELAEGARLYAARGCAECHGDDGGGREIVSDPVLGVIRGTNLTRGAGGIPSGYTNADLVRAVRHCVRPDGSAVLFMPCEETNLIPERELAAILAHVRRLPPVDREHAAVELGLVGHALHAFGVLPLVKSALVDFDAPPPPAPPAGPTAAWGERLARIQCAGCHGEGLTGGRLPGVPPSLPVPTNLTPDPSTGLGRWSRAEFATLLRTGRRPDGTEVDPFMPWRTYRHLNEVEIEALWAYLRSLPPRPFGGR